jgi:hypothetical protein
MAYAPTKTKQFTLTDLFNQLKTGFTQKPITPQAGFSMMNQNLPNNGGTFQTPTPTPNMSMAPTNPNMSMAPSTTQGPVKPTTTVTKPPTSRVFNGGNTPAPVVPPTPTPPALDYSKYTNPATGQPYTPDEYAEVVAKRATASDIPGYAGDTLTQGPQTAEQLARTARELNNNRNDISTGATDPYNVASKSGIQYTPGELAAIEKAYAGVYDPALQDVFTKLDTRKKEDAAEKTRLDNIQKAELESTNRLKELGVQHKYDVELKKTRSGDYKDDGAGGGSGGGTGEFAATVDLVANMEPSVYGKKSVAGQLRSLIDAKDYASAYNTIANSIENQLVGESKQKYVNARTDYSVMQGMKEAVEKYAAGGGDMNILKGTEEEIKRKLGIDSGKASELAVYLWREFQTYRNNMTGAAFGAAESRDYASVNPSLGKTLDLNLSVINGAQQQLKNRVISTIDERVPSAKYIREYAEGVKPSAGATVTAPDGTVIEIID